MTHLCNLNTPQHNYQAAQRVVQRFLQAFGIAALEEQVPQRCNCGWWSPLFPAEVLTVGRKKRPSRA